MVSAIRLSRREFIESNAFLYAVLAAFAILRLLPIALIPLTPVADCLWYFDRAAELAQGLGYRSDGVPTAFYPIGYAAFLGGVFALFGAHVWVGSAANVVLGLGTCLLMYRLSLAMFKDAGAAALAVGLYAIYPNQIGYTMALGTEVLYAFLLVLAFVVLSHGQKSPKVAFAFGVVLGFATLTKAQTLLLPLVLALYTFGKEISWQSLRTCVRQALIAYAALMLIVLPWSIRNYVELGQFVLNSTNGGLTLLVGNNPSATGDFSLDDPMIERVDDEIAAGHELAADRMAHDFAWEWMKEHPLRVIALAPKKIWRLWAPDGDSERVLREQYADYARFAPLIRAIRWANQAFYVLLMLGSAFAIAVLWRRRMLFEPLVDSGLVLGAFASLVSVIFFGLSRYHDFVMPWAAIYAGWILAEWRLERRLSVSSPLAVKT